MSIQATDDFNRADNANLGSLWDVLTSANSFAVASNKVAPTGFAGGAFSAETYNGVTWIDAQYSQVKVTTDGTGNGFGGGPLVRGQAGAETAYVMAVSHTDPGNNEIFIYKRVAGSLTTLASAHKAWTNGDTFTLAISPNGDIIGLINGVAIRELIIQDVSIGSGSPGIAHINQSTTTTTLDDWEGGIPDQFYGSRDWSEFPKFLLRKDLGVR